MVKKKSRLVLDGMHWGTLGEVTNVPFITKPKEKGGKKESYSSPCVEDGRRFFRYYTVRDQPDRPLPVSSDVSLGHSKSESRGSLATSPVFNKAQGHAHNKSSLVPHAALNNGSLPILPEVHRSLGLAGTMGGSVGSIAEQDYDGSDPDSDIPDELQVILSNLDGGYYFI